ncbi:MAG: nitroreductase family deazaflavin-dependent oxidoreductase [Nitrososphaerota archaeon]|nr:nitroreductase family deazaflavin-dependent oxidoreductase [Nitrososphaerota archaeon]MDG6922144.1 nitroreductase family deazaflavin-dependent oxidoreductase [Nitrososphaerota archaeon]
MIENIESVKNRKYIFVTTIGRKTGKAHEVELWFALADGKLYLSHEGKYTDWMKNMAKNNHVRARINSLEFRATGKILEVGLTRDAGAKALYEKYYQPATKAIIDDWFSLSTLVQLTPIWKPKVS